MNESDCFHPTKMFVQLTLAFSTCTAAIGSAEWSNHQGAVFFSKRPLKPECQSVYGELRTKLQYLLFSYPIMYSYSIANYQR